MQSRGACAQVGFLMVGLLLAGRAFAQAVPPTVEELPEGPGSLVFPVQGEAAAGLAVCLGVEKLGLPAAGVGSEDWTPVPPSMVFASGDKVRFSFTPTGDSFAYLICKHSDGTRSVLWPSVESGTESQVKAGQTVILPQSGGPFAGWVFADPPGTEEVILLLASAPIPELEGLIKGSNAPTKPKRPLTQRRCKQVEEAMSSLKGGTMRRVPNPEVPNQPYVACPDPTAPIKVRVLLRHGPE
ncbi:MAG: DUF4384 domain-containing protein [Candidatus Omnitrophica bacterium]|nr:hypothetical protein [bacterium]NUN97371.1 DUF4384 domain-containing protein [Candidatus Omnitrophota bacterium]